MSISTHLLMNASSQTTQNLIKLLYYTPRHFLGLLLEAIGIN